MCLPGILRRASEALPVFGELHRSNLRSALDDGVHNLVKAGIARRARDTMNVLQVQVGSPGAETHSDRHASLDADNPCLRPQACGAEGIGDSTVGESATGCAFVRSAIAKEPRPASDRALCVQCVVLAFDGFHAQQYSRSYQDTRY